MAADANKDMTDLPLYDPLDDDSIEAFRRHFATNTFGWPSTIPPTVAHIPTRFEERYYALRSGVQNWTTSSSTEIADDLMAVRIGADQRWQTKRGRPDNMHILDWITLDTNMTFYPDARPRQFRRDARAVGLRFPLARGRPAHPGQRRPVRRFQRRTKAMHRRRLSEPAATRQLVHGLPRLGRTDQQPNPRAVLHVFDESKMDVVVRHVGRLRQPAQLLAELRHHANRRVAVGPLRFLGRSGRATAWAWPSPSSRGSCRRVGWATSTARRFRRRGRLVWSKDL